MSLEYVKYFNLFGEEVAQVPSILGNGNPEGQADNKMVSAAEPGCFYMDVTSGELYKSIQENNEIKWKIIGSGEVPGKITESGGEIFNDYENNQAGSKAFTVLGVECSSNDGSTSGTFTLDNTEGLAVGDEFSVHIAQGADASLQCDNVGKITAINGNSVSVDRVFNNSAFSVSNFQIWEDGYLNSDGTDSEVNTFRVPLKPEVGTRSIGAYSSARGRGVKALSKGSSAEGNGSIAAGSWSHAEGNGTYAAYSAHSEGGGTKAIGQNSHAEGQNTEATSYGSHAEGYLTKATSNATHAEGRNTQATAPYAHSEGNNTKADGESSHAEGNGTLTQGLYTHAEGNTTKALGRGDHAEGDNTLANSQFPQGANQWMVGAHAEGAQTKALNLGAHAEGYATVAFGTRSHAEGEKTNAGGQASHAEGWGGNNLPYANYTLPGNATVTKDWIKTKFLLAKGQGSHAEGNSTLALGNFSHAEGKYTLTYGDNSHAEGAETITIGEASHAEGSATQAKGKYSHVEGNNTIASIDGQHVQGQYNIEDTEGKYAHIIGWGSGTAPKNIHTVDTNGNAWFEGDVIAGEVSLQELNKQVGYISTALDAIITQQQKLIGGESV